MGGGKGLGSKRLRKGNFLTPPIKVGFVHILPPEFFTSAPEVNVLVTELLL